MRLKSYSALFAITGLLGMAFAAHADELAQKGREIFEKNQHAVVTVTEVPWATVLVVHVVPPVPIV